MYVNYKSARKKRMTLRRSPTPSFSTHAKNEAFTKVIQVEISSSACLLYMFSSSWLVVEEDWGQGGEGWG